MFSLSVHLVKRSVVEQNVKPHLERKKGIINDSFKWYIVKNEENVALVGHRQTFPELSSRQSLQQNDE